MSARAAPGPTWHSAEPPPPMPARYGLRDWLRILRRGGPLALVTFGCLGLLLAVRLVERPLFGLSRPLTPHITQFVCRAAFVLMGMRRRVEGRPMAGAGAFVANHSSWLDIFALNACKRIYFVSKAEVAGWPGIGWLARATGTLFIERDRRKAPDHRRLFERRLAAGHALMFFPEGTSTDGRRVLPFKTTLFQAFLSEEAGRQLMVQPVTLAYTAPAGEDPRFYGWWGEMEFGAHLLKVLAVPRPGAVTVIYHAPLAAADHASRKALAAALEDRVRAGLAAAL